MKTIDAARITAEVKKLCILSNTRLPRDVKDRLESARKEEPWPFAREILSDIVDNYRLAEKKGSAICQDTGLACVFLEIGQDVHVEGDLREAVNEGVRQGYTEGYLRKSVVSDPLERINTGDNTPAFLYLDIVPGEELRITVAPKGAGSENASSLRMLKPSDGESGVFDFVLDAVRATAPNACAPVVVGVGIGGNFDRVALLAKLALLRPLDVSNANPRYAGLEGRLLEAINATGIGPQGLGGRTTALAVNIEAAPTHIAQLPCAVNINCHVTRHCSAVL